MGTFCPCPKRLRSCMLGCSYVRNGQAAYCFSFQSPPLETSSPGACMSDDAQTQCVLLMDISRHIVCKDGVLQSPVPPRPDQPQPTRRWTNHNPPGDGQARQGILDRGTRIMGTPADLDRSARSVGDARLSWRSHVAVSRFGIYCAWVYVL
jgi:hypothetical protein